MAYHKISLAEKIANQQAKVNDLKARYDAESQKLKELLDAKAAEDDLRLKEAIEASGKSFEDIMAFLTGSNQ